MVFLYDLAFQIFSKNQFSLFCKHMGNNVFQHALIFLSKFATFTFNKRSNLNFDFNTNSMGKRRRATGGAEKGKQHRLTVQLEFDGQRPQQFTTGQFRDIVDSAIGRVCGQAAPLYRVDSFDSQTMRGSLLMDGEHLHLLWAALSIYGVHLEQKIAFHLFSIHSE